MSPSVDTSTDRRRLLATLVIIVAMVVGGACNKERSSGDGDRGGVKPEQSSSVAAEEERQGAVAPEGFADPGAAVAAVLERDKPRLVGFGEVHQRTRSQTIRSSLARFTEWVVPALARAGASSMVLETWVERPECGEAQARVDGQVTRDTERPAQTRSELEILLAATDALGIARHGMAMSCSEYESLLDEEGTVDYARLLSLITDKLGSQAKEVLAHTEGKGLVFVYGGALHNTIAPNEGVESWSYVTGFDAPLRKRYVEIDFFVPELIAEDEVLAAEPWYSLLDSERLAREVLLIPRGSRSYVILARRGLATAGNVGAVSAP